MTIQIDTREKPRAIVRIRDYFDRNGIEYFMEKLDVGDYMIVGNPMRIVDRKQNLEELCKNVSTVPQKDEYGHIKRGKDGKPLTDHARFIRELERAQDRGVQLIILCEHGGSIRTLSDVAGWVNPRLRESKLAMSGKRLHQILLTLEKTYGVQFLFCDKRRTGAEIVRILSGDTP